MASGSNDTPYNSVPAKMTYDGVTIIVILDLLILTHGQNLYGGFNIKKKSDVSDRMQEMKFFMRVLTTVVCRYVCTCAWI